MNLSRKSMLLCFLTLGVAGLLFAFLPVSGRTKKAAAPAPLAKVPPGRAQAILAGGCFWSMEAIFKQLKGVDRVEPGYSGGKRVNPSYEQVSNGDTGHAESIRVIYDPKVISYRDLLRVFFTVHDPTTPDRQGNDVGPQYRSIVFYADDAQKQAARQVLKEIDSERLWPGKAVTQVVPFNRFYRAEEYHLDYYRLHPLQPYCRFVIAPKVDKFRSKFKDRLKS
jgi:peptide-methionine (S)-S-oxide reductase